MDARRAVLRQDNLQIHITFEPALATAHPHHGGHNYSDDDKNERARDFVDAPEFETLAGWWALVAGRRWFQNVRSLVHSHR